VGLHCVWDEIPGRELAMWSRLVRNKIRLVGEAK